MNFKVTYAGGHVTSIQTFKSLFLIYYIQRGLVKNQLELGADVLFLIETVFFLQTIWGFNSPQFESLHRKYFADGI